MVGGMHPRRHRAAQHRERLGEHHHPERAGVEHPRTGSCRWRRRSWRSARRPARCAAPNDVANAIAPAVLQPVQRGPDQRRDHRERRDRDQQVQRRPCSCSHRWRPRRTTCWPARRPSRRRPRSWPSPARSVRSARTCRRRRRSRPGGTGRTSCEPISRLRMRRGAGDGDALRRWRRRDWRGRRCRCVATTGSSQRRQVPVGAWHRCRRVRRWPRLIAGVVGHPGMLVAAVRRRPRRVVPAIARIRSSLGGHAAIRSRLSIVPYRRSTGARRLTGVASGAPVVRQYGMRWIASRIRRRQDAVDTPGQRAWTLCWAPPWIWRAPRSSSSAATPSASTSA